MGVVIEPLNGIYSRIRICSKKDQDFAMGERKNNWVVLFCINNEAKTLEGNRETQLVGSH